MRPFFNYIPGKQSSILLSREPLADWDFIVETYEALVEERGEGGKIWGSMIKQTLKRRKPWFSESYYGFRSFGQLLKKPRRKGFLTLDSTKNPAASLSRVARVLRQDRYLATREKQELPHR